MQTKWTLGRIIAVNVMRSTSALASRCAEGTKRETPANTSSRTNMATPGYFQLLAIPVHTESIVTLSLHTSQRLVLLERTVQHHSRRFLSADR